MITVQLLETIESKNILGQKTDAADFLGRTVLRHYPAVFFTAVWDYKCVNLPNVLQHVVFSSQEACKLFLTLALMAFRHILSLFADKVGVYFPLTVGYLVGLYVLTRWDKAATHAAAMVNISSVYNKAVTLAY